MNTKNISKEALVFNAEFFSGFAPKICAVVKANAYGHGMREVALALKGHVDFFGVSSIDEAKALEKIVKGEKIVVIGRCFDFSNLDKFYLTASSIEDIQKAIKTGKTEKCFIKLCTGMNRFGIDCKNQNLLEKVKNLIKNHQFAGFSAHFSNLSSKRVTKKEYDLFCKARLFLNKKAFVSFGGSGAKNLPCDMLRVGLGLYGYGCKGLKKAMSLTSEVVELRTLEKGETAGYNQTFKAKRRTTLAVVGVGYGDGFSREKSKFVKVNINGKKYNIVGNMCMDCCFVDVTGGTVCVKDQVKVFDNATVFAKAYRKIEYNVLTNFSLFRGKTKVF